MKITALIPAHNEEGSITASITGLLEQTVPPDLIVVVADNCTDGTEAQVRKLDGEKVGVFGTKNNTHRKAGALNQALNLLLPFMEEDDIVLVMDADTIMSPKFLETVQRRLQVSEKLGAVGAVFRGEEPTNILELMQSNEYTRYARKIDRTGRVGVLSGTAAGIRVKALREVAGYRGTLLPGKKGEVYDRESLTEDNELTLALKTVGWKLESPVVCKTVTELMPDVRMLFRQRVRWYRGALENLPRYGFTPVTRMYWFQQGMLTFTTLMMSLYLLTSFLILVRGEMHVNGFWLAIGGIFWLERMVTVWSNGWKARLVASVIFLEMSYDLILMAAFATGAFNALARTESVWHHKEAVNV